LKYMIWTVDYKTASAVPVQKDAGAGAVNVHGIKLDIIMTGPDQGEGWWLIVLEPGQYHVSRIVCNFKKPVCWVSLQGLCFKTKPPAQSSYMRVQQPYTTAS
jgi:hypothetical protein